MIYDYAGLFSLCAAEARRASKAKAALPGLRTASQYCHSQLLVGAEVRPRRTKELKELYLAVNRIGTNINQIARKVNAGFGTRNDMQELLYLMGQIELQMSSIAER